MVVRGDLAGLQNIGAAMNVTLEQLRKIMPAGKRLEEFVVPLNNAMSEFGITSERQVEMFLAQLAHESGDLNLLTEGLNYSADGLANTWPTRYAAKDSAGKYITEGGRKMPNDLARRLHRNKVAIANNVYASRMGNGDEASGDGWLFRGAGAIQLTGRDNQGACADHFGIPMQDIGDWLRTPEGAVRSAAWFWKRAGANELAEAGNFDAVSDVINLGRRTAKYGDSIGFHDRVEALKAAQAAIDGEMA
jgi:putative chitinase